MSYKVLYRKYRPTAFNEVVGQTNIVEILKQSIINNKSAHAYIFTGIRGTGKTSVAKIFAKAINCLNLKEGEPCNKCDNCQNFETSPDIIEIDAASNNGVEEMRELVGNSRLVPTSLNYKVYIIDEVHMLSSSAYNALLKTLEEPVEHVKFILATTEIHKVPLTILSRCQRFDFTKINNELIVTQLKKISKKEKISISNDVLNEIAELSDGALRDALGILDQLSNNEEKIEIEDLEKTFSYVSSEKIIELIEIIKNKNMEVLLEQCSNLSSRGVDINSLINKLINVLKENIYGAIKSNNEEIDYNKNLIFALIETQKEIKLTSNPYLVFEMKIISFMLENQQKSDKNDKMSTKLNIDKEKKEEKIEMSTKLNIDKSETKMLKEEGAEDNTNFEDIKYIRINNCLAKADKKIKSEMTKQWKVFLENLQDSNAQLFSMLEHSRVEVASTAILIISAPVNGAIKLLDDQTQDIEKAFKNFTSVKIKLCFITVNTWEKEKEKYINSRENNIKYIEMEEPKLQKKNIKAMDVAIDIFGEDNVDIR